jgi:hypothetical protein
VVRTAGEAPDRTQARRAVVTIRQHLEGVVGPADVGHEHLGRSQVQSPADSWKGRAADPDQRGGTTRPYGGEYAEHAGPLVLGEGSVLQVGNHEVRAAGRQQFCRCCPGQDAPHAEDRFASAEPQPKREPAVLRCQGSEASHGRLRALYCSQTPRTAVSTGIRSTAEAATNPTALVRS